MNKYVKWFVGVILLFFALMFGGMHVVSIATGVGRTMEDRIPYEFDNKASNDLLLFRELLEVDNEVVDISRDLMEVDYDYADQSTIIYAESFHDLQPYEIDELAVLLEMGASVIIASKRVRKLGSVGNSDTDTLLNYHYRYYYSDDSLFHSSIPEISDSYTGSRLHGHGATYGFGDEWEILLWSTDSSQSTMSLQPTNNVLAAKRNVGLGTLYVLESPLILSNEILVDSSQWRVPFVLLEGCDFSYTYFVEYSRIEKEQKEDWSALGWLFEHQALTAAWWMMLFTLAVVYFGKARRRQHIIPLRELVVNQSVEFNNQVAALYAEKEDHSIILEETLESCLRRIRESRGVDVYILTPDLEKVLVREVMLPSKLAEKLAALALMLEREIQIDDDDFLQFCQSLREVNEIIG